MEPSAMTARRTSFMSTPFRLPAGRPSLNSAFLESVPEGIRGEYRVTPTRGTSPMVGLRHKH
jgi:hypothetical protein